MSASVDRYALRGLMGIRAPGVVPPSAAAVAKTRLPDRSRCRRRPGEEKSEACVIPGLPDEPTMSLWRFPTPSDASERELQRCVSLRDRPKLVVTAERDRQQFARTGAGMRARIARRSARQAVLVALSHSYAVRSRTAHAGTSPRADFCSWSTWTTANTRPSLFPSRPSRCPSRRPLHHRAQPRRRDGCDERAVSVCGPTPHTEPYSKSSTCVHPCYGQPTFSDHELTGAVISPTFSGQRFSAVAAMCWR